MTMRRRSVCAALLTLAAGRAFADEPLSGLIRTWGHGRRDRDILGSLVRAWQQGFARLNPGVRFETTLRGDATAIGGLYTGAADLALMERPPLAIELDGYQPIFGGAPFEVMIATGSLDVDDHAFAPVVLVHRDNPVEQLTLAQLDAAFGADRRRGGTPARRWKDLGLGGAWADEPIRLYAPDLDGDVAQFFERTVMSGSQKWASPLSEFHGAQAEAQLATALAKDRFGLGIAGLQHARGRSVKALALATQSDGPFFAASRETVKLRQYPLARSVSIYLNRKPGTPLAPTLKAYLSYLLGPAGQDAIRRDGRYLPLTPELARRELEKLQ